MIKVELYRLNVVDGSYKRIDIISTHSALEYQEIQNGVGQCTFSMNILDSKLTKANFIEWTTHISLKEGNEVLWFGPFSHFSGLAQNVAGQVQINCYSFLSHFNYRITNKFTTYVKVDQAALYRDLITTSQNRTNGKLGITVGSETTGILRTRTYEYKKISEALTEFSDNIDASDFDFIPVLDSNHMVTGVRFVVYNLKKGSYRADLPPIRTGKLGNVLSFGFGTDGDLYNYIVTEGTGSGDTIMDEYDSGPLQISYSRLEKYLPRKDIVELSTLQHNLASYANENSVPQIKVNIVLNPKKRPFYGTEFFLGDTLNIDLKATDIKATAGDLISFQGQAKVVEIKVDVDDQGVKTIIPKLIYYN